MPESNAKNIWNALFEADKILITTHIKPDGDGIGSEIALLKALKSKGKNVFIINDSPTPKAFQFLVQHGEIVLYKQERDSSLIKSTDAICVLDVSTLCRLDSMEKPIRESRAKRICIDHHLEDSSEFNFAFTDPTASATGELVFTILKENNVEITPEIANPLFAAISIDSGSFSYERCSEKTFEAAKELVRCGAKPYFIHKNLNWCRSKGEILIEGVAIKNLKLYEEGHIAFTTIDYKSQNKFNVDAAEIATIVNLPLSISGVIIAILMVEMENGSIKVSIRSKGGISIRELARIFHGGGHPLAAGFNMEGPMEKSKKIVLDSAISFYKERLTQNGGCNEDIHNFGC